MAHVSSTSSPAIPLAAPCRAAASPFPERLRRWSISGLPLLIGVLVSLPLLLLLLNSFNVAPVDAAASYGLANWSFAFSDPTTLSSLWNSLLLALVRQVFSLPLALLFAWLVARTDMPGRQAIEVLFWLGIFTPILPLTMGWILLLDPRVGLVNTFLHTLGISASAPFNVYGFWGITWVHVVSDAISYKVVLLTPAFRRVGATMEEAALVCGASMRQATLKITLPLLAPAILLVTLMSLVFSFQGFEVEQILGVPVRFYVFSTRLYNLVSNQPSNVGAATALGFICLVWLLGLACLYRWLLRGKSFTTVTGTGYVSRPIGLGKWRWVATAACCLYFAIGLAAPFALLVIGSFMRLYGFFNVPNPYTLDHWRTVLADPAFASGMRNTLVISTSAAIGVVVLYSLVSYALVRHRSRTLQITDFLVWTPWAMPGILMGLGFLWLFLATPARTLFYGSAAAIAVAFIARGSPLSTQLFKTSLMQISADLEGAARVCGASWLQTYRVILLPLLAPIALTVGLLTFLTSVYDIGTAVLLYTPASRPLSILMLEYQLTGASESSAVLGVLITLFVLAVLLGARTLGYRLSRDRL